jgi:hypothetical protein
VEEAELFNSDTSEDNASVSDEAASQAENETSTNNDVGEIDITQDDQRRYPARTRRPPTSWWASMTAAAEKCHGPTIVPEEHNACRTAKTAANDSPTLKEALDAPDQIQWMEAISKELESLTQAGTWNVADRPTVGARVFPSKFVLKIKRNSDGTIERQSTSSIVGTSATSQYGLF